MSASRCCRVFLILACCMAMYSGFALAQSPISLVLSHNASKGTARAEAFERFAELVKEKSGGRMVIEINPGGGSQENRDVLLDVRTGKIDLFSFPQGRLAPVLPEVDALGLPYVFSSGQKAMDILDGPLGQDLADKAEGRGLILLAWMTNGGRHLTNQIKPIQKPEDLRGLRIRTTGDKATIDMMLALGVQVAPISYNYLDDALQTGYVDGQENSMNLIWLRKMHEKQKFIAVTNHNFSFSPLVMGASAWGKLSSGDKKLLKAAAMDAAILERKRFEEAENRIIDDYRRMPDVILTTPDPGPFRAAVQKVWDAWELKSIGAFVKKLRAATSR